MLSFASSGALARILPTVGGKSLLNKTKTKMVMLQAGTPHYTAPEMYRGEYDEKVPILHF